MTTDVVERPIPFSDEMVRKILADQKTQTRRIIKKPITPTPARIESSGNGWGQVPSHVYLPTSNSGKIGIFTPMWLKCPYGQPGGRLWVREAWRIGAWREDNRIAVDYRSGGYARREWLTVPDDEMFERFCIQSTDDAIKAGLQADEEGFYHWEVGQAPMRWRLPRFMPRFVSRILLELTGVRVERLQDISDADILAEGFPLDPPSYADGLAATWNTINGDGAWEANPWVWVLDFRRITDSADSLATIS